MKKRFPTILSAIACGLVILCLMQISDLKNQVHQLQNQSDGSQAAPLADTYITIYDAQGNLLWDDTYK